MYIHEYGKKLKKLREAAKLSQRQVGDSLGLTSGQFISNWEAGKAAPSAKMASHLAKVYKCPIATITGIIEGVKVGRVRAKVRASKS